VVRAGESYQGKQGPDYTPGISAESAGAHALRLGSVTILPAGGRTKAHVHESHGSAFFLVSGDEVELYTADDLEQREVARSGDYLYIPAGVPHVASTGVRRLRCSSSTHRSERAGERHDEARARQPDPVGRPSQLHQRK
jgi:uncharacterized RmlC-like cupin family protein